MTIRFPFRSCGAALIGLVTAGFLFALDVSDENRPENAQGIDVRGERRDGSTFDGKLNERILLTTDYGSQEIEAKHIGRISLHPPGDDKTSDTVELKDKTRLRGRIKSPDLRFWVNNQAPSRLWRHSAKSSRRPRIRTDCLESYLVC